MSDRSNSSALVPFTIVLLIAGLIGGLIVANSELGHPISSVAQARLTTRQKELDIVYYEKTKQAELDAVTQRYQRELAIIEQKHQSEMKQSRERQQIMLALLPGLVICICLGFVTASLGLAYYLVCLGRSRVASTQVPLVANWQDSRLRAEAVRQARAAELQWRALQPAGDGSRHSGHSGAPIAVDWPRYQPQGHPEAIHSAA